MIWEVLYDKVGDMFILISSAGFVAMFKWKKDTDKKLTGIELELAKNYVTKPELKTVEDKLDHLSDTMGTKIDRVNDNLMLLLRTPNA